MKLQSKIPARLLIAVNKGGNKFQKILPPYISLSARHSNFSTVTKRARVRARKEMSDSTAVYFLREIVAMCPRRRRWRMRRRRRRTTWGKRRRGEREAEACLEHPGGGGPRWRPRSVVSRFLLLSVSFSRLNSPISSADPYHLALFWRALRPWNT